MKYVLIFVVFTLIIELCSVPSMVADLTGSSKACRPLSSLMFGGAPAPDSLTMRAKQAFPTAVMFA